MHINTNQPFTVEYSDTLLGYAADLIQTTTADCGENWFIMAGYGRSPRKDDLWSCTFSHIGQTKLRVKAGLKRKGSTKQG